ncbi:DinB family protein [Flagellimonas sp. S174]|uniref:DinB family protein n=1 Tax=Flagellimonas sp. S174 TaxID=3410790 RepID=UPI003BF5E556
MNSAQLLAKRLKEVLTQGKWVIGTNFKAQIADLNWKEAIQKMHGLNTIADLTFHTSYYIAGVANVLEGGNLDIRDKHSFDYPPIASEQDWKNLVNKFYKDAERLIQLVENLSEEKLQETFVDEKYGSYHRNIDVIIEHSYYHFGQVVLLGKMIERAAKP